MKSWIKLDNAAKIFPSVTSKYRTNLFRISFSLTEEVDPLLLQESLNHVILRFKTFKLKLKSGLFWNYFEENRLQPQVVLENSYLLRPFDDYESRGYLFRITYFKNKIGLEMFHVITDGFGALQFLKALVYEYLILKGNPINDEGKILLELENAYEESVDSFQKLYGKNTKVDRTENSACHISGNVYSDNFIGMITGIVPRSDLKNMSSKYDASYTEIICGIIHYCACINMAMIKNKDTKPFQIFVPVDLRRKFPSKSLRNFSMVVKTSDYLHHNMTLEESIEMAKLQLREGLKNENLVPRVAGNVKLEKIFLLRIVPLFLKQIAFKIGYNRMSTKANSFCISNLGDIDLPVDMEKYVQKVTFANGTSKEAPLNIGVVYYKENVYITFSSSIMEREFQRTFFRTLSENGCNIIIENNDLEE